MLHKTTDNNLETLENVFLYPELKAAWDEISSTAKRREIIAQLGISEVHTWRIINTKIGKEPMRQAYFVILKKALLSDTETEQNIVGLKPQN